MISPIPHIVDLITTDKDKKFERDALMADAIIDNILERGDCLPSDLFSKGFDLNEVNARWHMAYSLATVELKCMNASTLSIFERGFRYA